MRLKAILLATCLSGCAAVGPDFKAPAIEETGSPLLLAQIPQGLPAAWWRTLGDRELNQIIEAAELGNLDLALARSRIDAALAVRRGTGLAAQASGGASVARTRTGVEEDSATLITNETALSLEADFIFDLFGGERRRFEAATAEAEATAFDAEVTRLAVLGDILGAFIELRYAQEAAALTRRSIATAKDLQAATDRQVELGDATSLDASRSALDVERSRSELPAFAVAYDVQALRLAQLSGTNFDQVALRLQQGAPQPLPPACAPRRMPVDAIRIRPDIQAAERRLRVAIAEIGVADAALLPSLTLSGSVIDTRTLTWSFGPRLALPIFNQSVLRADRDRARAAAEAAELEWRQTVQQAIVDVETALRQCLALQRRISIQRRGVAAAQDVERLTRLAFGAGEAPLSDVLEARREAVALEQDLAILRRDYALIWTRFQLALGGNLSLDAGDS